MEDFSLSLRERAGVLGMDALMSRSTRMCVSDEGINFISGFLYYCEFTVKNRIETSLYGRIKLSTTELGRSLYNTVNYRRLSNTLLYANREWIAIT